MNTTLSLLRSGAVLSLLVLTAACQRGGESPAGEATGAPAPADPRTSGLFAALTVPTNLDAEKVEMGARLYHDTNLSGDGTQSCSSCHNIAEGGDDGLVSSPGINGIPGPINSPTTVNSHLNFVQFWDGRAATLEEQAAGPVANPGEMGAVWADVVAYVAAEPWYAEKFAAEYPDGVTQANITHAIAEFERSLVTPARFDAWLQGDDNAMTAAELEGLALFQSTGCTSCHSGAGLGGSSYQRMGLIENYFEDRGNLTDADNGRFNVTQNEEDRHKFKVPILRNITLTAPYFHDGSHTDLGEAVRTMARYQLGKTLTDGEVTSIVAFLGTLEGEMPTLNIPPLPASRFAAAPADGSAAPSAGSGAPADGSAAAAPAEASSAPTEASAAVPAVAP